MANFIRETAEVIPHPTERGRSLWEAINDDGTLFGNGTDAVDAEVLSMKDLEFGATDSVGVTPLGSGSDYTVFLQRNGVSRGISDVYRFLEANEWNEGSKH